MIDQRLRRLCDLSCFAAALLTAACSQPDFVEAQPASHASVIGSKPEPKPAPPPAPVSPIVAAARRQVGKTVVYDSAYVRLKYPGGDVPIEKGVCSDVVVRALRAALNMDLQVLVHKDKTANSREYPDQWGVAKPDRNIDHRRVLNLKRYFERHGYSTGITEEPSDYFPGDIVTCLVTRNRAHVMIVSDRKAKDGTPLVIHNIGEGTREEDCLFRFPITGHYRIERKSESAAENSTPPPEKAVRKKRRIVHVYVAMADNKLQGIAPVPERLGNGNDAANNLYWGAAYGVKTFLDRSSDWKLISSTTMLSTSVLERCYFHHRSGNIILRADAYRGAKIGTAIRDFLADAGGESGADLVAYVGHNGLMEFTIPYSALKGNRKGTEVIALACCTKQYFRPWLERLGAKPMLLTNGLMAPEGYTLKAALDGWINGEPGVRIRERVAVAYNNYQNCGITAACRLFHCE
jgi:uncharacterized protein YijF (DUF1287 family)